MNKNDPGYLCSKFAPLRCLENRQCHHEETTVLLDDEHAPPYVMYRHLSFCADAVFLVGRERVVHQPDIAIEARIVATSKLLLAPRHDPASPNPQMRPLRLSALLVHREAKQPAQIIQRLVPKAPLVHVEALAPSSPPRTSPLSPPRALPPTAATAVLLLHHSEAAYLKLLTCFSVHLPVLYCDCCLTYNDWASDFVRDRASSISTAPSHRCGSPSLSLQLPGSIRHFRTTFSLFAR